MILQYVFVMLCLFWKTAKTTPIQSTPHPTIVLALDVSESMESRSRINKLEEALHSWIEFDVSDGIRLGMVEFSSTAKLLSDLVPISKESRQELIQIIPKIAQGETCIGCGLRLALELLESTESGGMVILITDVENSEPGQDVKDMFDQVKQARVKIVTIAVGNGAKLNDIEHLAELTGGLVYSIRDEEGVDGLLSALRGALTIDQKYPVTPKMVTLTYEENPMSTVMVHAETDNVTETNPAIKTTLDYVTTFVSFGENIDIPTCVQPSEALSSLSWMVLGIVVGVLFAVIVLVILVMLLRRKYRVTRIHGKYLLAKLGEGQQL